MKNLFTTHNSQLTKFAFTLAETLIVMGVIGVVAALTLPNLNSSTGDKEKVVKVKKIYQNLNDAVGRAVAIYGPIDEWYKSEDNDLNKKSKRAFNRIAEFLKTSKIDSDNFTAITADGTEIKIYGEETKDTSIMINIDIDGAKKGSNTYSKDQFSFEINDSAVTIPNKTDGSSNICSTNTKILANLAMCASAWIINYDNMDYLKCKDKLSETVTSCK